MTPQPLTLEQLAATYNVSALAPEIALTLFAMAVLLAGAFASDSVQRFLLPALALAGTALTALLCVPLWGRDLTFGARETAIYAVDNFALFFKWIFLIGLGVSILLSGRVMQSRRGDRHTVAGEYYALMMLSTAGMMMVAGARDLLVIFLGIETLSIALYILAGFARTRLMSNEAALKYFLLGAFATGFLLYGIALTYFATGSTHLDQIRQNVAGGVQSPTILYLGVALLLIGLGFKAALVPFHQWTPDVYEGSPTPVTAFMAVGAKAAAFAALLRVFPGALGTPEASAQWFNIVLVISILTMTVGNVVAISQTSLKRMFAYSSIAHAGYLLMGVLAAGGAIRNSMPDAAARANAGVLFYLVVYALMNLGAFAVLVYLENTRAGVHDEADEEANLTVDDLRGLAWKRPLLGAAMTIFLFSLAGVPPTAGFFGKFYIFTEAFRQNLLGLVLVGAINTVISTYYYLRPVMAMFAPNPNDERSQTALVPTDGALLTTDGAPALGAGAMGAPALTARLPLAVVFTIALCVAGVVLMIVLQGAAFEWAKEAAPLGVTAGAASAGQ